MTNNLQGKISLTNTLKGGQILHKGPKGETGLSAYEIALKNGYEGTEEEWLNSLKGDDGEKGEKGDPTATIEINRVVTGEAGTDVKVENVGTDVNLKLDISIPRGDKGEQGVQGNPGENGLDGYTPIKGTDYFTDSEIQTIKQDILNDISSFDLLVVESLPTSDIKEKTIYLVPNEEQQEDNVYDEYIYVNSKWEVIGSTAIDPTKLKVNLIEKSYKVTLTEKVEAGGTITLPANYKVGSDRLDVFFNGEKLIKAINDDSQGHYYEVGTEDMSSNTIKLTSDWSANVGDVFEFSIRTNGEGKAEEVVVDSIPIGTVIDYEGDTVPEGYEEVEDDIVNTLTGDETNKAPSVHSINSALSSLANAKTIWNGDFNNLKSYKTGLFCGLPMSNPPVDYTGDSSNCNWYIVQIYYSDSYYIQIATTLLDHASYDKKIYMRKCFNGTLSNWSSITFS